MIRTVAETGSTNADLLDRIRAGEQVLEGEWLVADRQTAGRGRQGRGWFDGHGNFMGSTVVRAMPGDPPAHTLSLVTGIALHEAVMPFCPDDRMPMLKWPNDLLVGGAKLSGILLESTGPAVVVGVGVNLKRAPDLPDRSTIALSAFGPAPDRDFFAAELARNFADILQRWRTYGLEPILRQWSALATPLGTPLSVHEPGGALIAGEFAGLAEDGSLRLRLADGSSRAIHAGDVTLA